MPRTTGRVLTLLELLQSGGTRTASELAERLGVDERTVRRYVDQLIDLDVPVESVRGRYGGYRIGSGYRLPPLMLSDDEALAVLLGLTAVRRSRSPAAAAPLGAAGTTAGETAAAKIRRVLPARLARRLDAVLASLSFTADLPAAAGAPGEGTVAPVPDAAVLLPLADAVRNRRPVAVRYTDRAGRRTDRTLHPYRIVAHAGRWYVTARDTGPDEDRTLRLDRIAGARVMPGTFDAPEDPEPARRLLSSFANAEYRYRVSLRIHGSAGHIRARFPASVAVLEAEEPDEPEGPEEPDADAEGWWRVELRAERLDWLPPLLAALDRPFTVERPEELRSLVREFADRLTARARGA